MRLWFQRARVHYGGAKAYGRRDSYKLTPWSSSRKQDKRTVSGNGSSSLKSCRMLPVTHLSKKATPPNHSRTVPQMGPNMGAVLIQTTTYNKGFNHFAMSPTTTWSIYCYSHLVPWHLTLTTKQTLNLSPTQIIAPPIPHLVGLREYYLSTVGLDSYHYSLCSPLISILLSLIRFNLQTPTLTQPLSPFCSFFSCHSAIVLGFWLQCHLIPLKPTQHHGSSWSSHSAFSSASLHIVHSPMKTTLDSQNVSDPPLWRFSWYMSVVYIAQSSD